MLEEEKLMCTCTQCWSTVIFRDMIDGKSEFECINCGAEYSLKEVRSLMCRQDEECSGCNRGCEKDNVELADKVPCVSMWC